jgi:hypothetical protein
LLTTFCVSDQSRHESFGHGFEINFDDMKRIKEAVNVTALLSGGDKKGVASASCLPFDFS